MIDKIYFYNEYINFGNLKNFLDRIKNSNKILLNVLFQIMISIIAIQKFFNMVHTDLHLDNILVQIVKPGGYWVYKLNDIKYYLPNLGFAILLHDFGFSLIPQKLYINWHHKNVQNYIIYDLISIIKIFLNHRLPSDFKKIIKTCFVDELNNIYSSKSLSDKFRKIFYEGQYGSLKINNYKQEPQNSLRIEEYDLDKKFDKTSLPDNYRELVN